MAHEIASPQYEAQQSFNQVYQGVAAAIGPNSVFQRDRKRAFDKADDQLAVAHAALTIETANQGARPEDLAAAELRHTEAASERARVSEAWAHPSTLARDLALGLTQAFDGLEAISGSTAQPAVVEHDQMIAAADQRHEAFANAVNDLKTSLQTFEAEVNPLTADSFGPLAPLAGRLRPAEASLTHAHSSVARAIGSLRDTATVKVVVGARYLASKTSPAPAIAMMNEAAKLRTEKTMPSSELDRLDRYQVRPALKGATELLLGAKKPADNSLLRAAWPQGAVEITRFAVSAVAGDRGLGLLTTAGNWVNSAGEALGTATAALISAIYGYPANPDLGSLECLESPLAFTNSVTKMFGGTPTGMAEADLAALHLAESLLEHAGHCGRALAHPLRHEEPLLIAMALRQATNDPAIAFRLLNGLKHADQVPALLAPGRSPQHNEAAEADALHPADNGLIQKTKRLLAGTASGMDALLHLQGVETPSGLSSAEARNKARNNDHYKQFLRAESAVINQAAFALRPESTSVAIRTRLEDAELQRRHGDEKALGAGGHESRGTLAFQAFQYLDGSVNALDRPDLDRYKPAYLALRNGYTESGAGTAFNKMLGHMKSFRDEASRTIETGDLAPAQRLSNFWHGARPHATSRMLLLGSMQTEVSTGLDEHKTMLGKALMEVRSLLPRTGANVQDNLAAIPEVQTQVRSCALELWMERARTEGDPTQIALLKSELQAKIVERFGQAGTPAAASNLDTMIDEALRPQSQPRAAAALLADWASEASGAVAPDLRSLLDGLQANDESRLAARRANFEAFKNAGPDERKSMLIQLVVDAVGGGDMFSQKTQLTGGAEFTVNVPASQESVSIPFGFSGIYRQGSDQVLGTASNFFRVSGSAVTSLDGGIGLGVGIRNEHFSTGAQGGLDGGRVRSEGFNVYARKAGSDHLDLSDDASLTTSVAKGNRRVMEKATRAMLETYPDNTGPDNGAKLWRHLTDVVGDHTDLSFSLFSSKATYVKNSLTGIVSAGFHPIHEHELTLMQSARSAAHSVRRDLDWVDSHGSLRTANSAITVANGINARSDSIVTRIPLFETGIGPIEGDIDLRAAVQVGGEIAVSKTAGAARFSMVDGRIDPSVSFKQREFSSRETFMKFLESEKQAWAQATTTSEMADFMKLLMQGSDPIKRTYIERKSLRPEAAAVMNAHLTQVDLLKQLIDAAGASLAPGGANIGPDLIADAKAAVQYKQSAIRAEMTLESNWQPFRLFANDFNQKVDSLGASTPTRIALEEELPVNPNGAGVQLHRDVTTTGGRDILVLNALTRAAPTRDDLRALERSALAPVPRPMDRV